MADLLAPKLLLGLISDGEDSVSDEVDLNGEDNRLPDEGVTAFMSVKSQAAATTNYHLGSGWILTAGRSFSRWTHDGSSSNAVIFMCSSIHGFNLVCLPIIFIQQWL